MSEHWVDLDIDYSAIDEGRMSEQVLMCMVDECGLEVKRNVKGISQGYCAEHVRWNNSRSRPNGMFANVDRLTIGAGGNPAYLQKSGYVHLWTPEGTIAEHKYVMQEILGRSFRPGENVHHKNGIRADNSPENLELWVKQQPAGQRVSDLIDFVVRNYPQETAEALRVAPGGDASTTVDPDATTTEGDL